MSKSFLKVFLAVEECKLICYIYRGKRGLLVGVEATMVHIAPYSPLHEYPLLVEKDLTTDFNKILDHLNLVLHGILIFLSNTMKNNVKVIKCRRKK